MGTEDQTKTEEKPQVENKETEQPKEETEKSEKETSGNEVKEKTEPETKAEKGDTEKKPEEEEPKPTVHKFPFEQDRVYLYQFSRTPTVPSISPFCLKAETWLRIAGLGYENVDHKCKFKSKKGQLPFVEFNGEEIGDSALIIRDLGKHFNHDLDDFLTAEQRSQGHAAISMIENHLWWCIFSWRVCDIMRFKQAAKIDLKQFMSCAGAPGWFLDFVWKWKFRKGIKKVRAHGLGVHTPQEIDEFAQNDLKCLSGMLGDQTYYFGEQPSLLDIVSFSFMAQICMMDKEVPYPLREWMSENTTNLVDHVNRMKEKFYQDWDEIVNNLDLNSHLPKPPPVEEVEEKKEEEKTEEKPEAEKEKTEEKEKDNKEVEKEEKAEEKEKESKD